MKPVIVLNCCSYEIKTHSKSYEFIDCLKLKPGQKFFKKYLPDGREVKREILLLARIFTLLQIFTRNNR